MADRHVDDRYISSETGQIVSKEFAAENPQSTYLRTNFVNGKLVAPTDVDPRIAPVVQALEAMVRETEDYNVAEFYADAVGLVTNLYRDVMKGRER